MRCCLLALPLLVFAAPAGAQDAEFCANRPGLGTPACTMPAGQVMIELGLADWEHSVDAATVEDSLTFGDLLVRFGIDDRTEIEAGITGYGSIRTRSQLGGATTRTGGLGDAMLAVRRNVSGNGGPVAIEGFVTLPTGHSGIGAGDWGAGLLVPIDLDLPHGFELDLTPELDAAVNADGSGRHLAWGGVAGIGHAVGKELSAEAEIGVWRDGDPSGHSTDVRAALSLAWQAGKDWQVDIEGDAGLSAAAPRSALAVGLAHRF